MIKTLTCQDCGRKFVANTENVNELGMVLDIQCTCGSWEVNIAKNEKIEQILPKHLRKELNPSEMYESLHKEYFEISNKLLKAYEELIALNKKRLNQLTAI